LHLRFSSCYPAQDNTNHSEQDDLLCSHQVLLAQKHYFRRHRKFILRQQNLASSRMPGDSPFLHEWRTASAFSWKALTADGRLEGRGLRADYSGCRSRNSREVFRTFLFAPSVLWYLERLRGDSTQVPAPLVGWRVADPRSARTPLACLPLRVCFMQGRGCLSP
jgi:hypothetical protein